MVKFCPTCEKLLKKKIDSTGIYLACTSCDFKELIQYKHANFDSISHSSDTMLASERKMKKVPEKIPNKQSNLEKSKLKQKEALGQEILLLELKKKNFEAQIPGYDGIKKTDLMREVKYLSEKIKELTEQYIILNRSTKEDEEKEL